ncbi:MAG: 50S ribosomal protein L33 [bacterium]|nr:50S ribosomal protein L33 [bacterium]
MRDNVMLSSTAGTGFFYTTTKKKGSPKIERNKYDPVVKKHVKFVEKKLPGAGSGKK